MIPLRDDIPSRSRPWVSWLLMGGCVWIFFWQMSLSDAQNLAAIHAFGLIPVRLFGYSDLPSELSLVPAWLTIFSAMFLHGSWLHLIGNLLYLWIFAENVEDRLGRGRFLLLYVLCGIAAAMAQAVPAPHAEIPMVGASGALSGILGAYLLWFPRANVLVLIPLGFFISLIRLPAVFVLALWFALQLLAEVLATQSGVAVRAHIGGFVAGLLLAPLLARR